MTLAETEKGMGIGFFSTTSKGLGGRLRQLPEDFIVKEVLVDDVVAEPKRYESDKTGTGGFLICVLEKRGLDTLTSVRRIAKKLEINEDRIDFAGLKDARALTYQFVTIQRKRPSEIIEFQTNRIRLFPVLRSNRPITSGMLAQNEFKISLRDIDLQEEEARRRAESVRTEILKAGGVPNFFGHQRFGTIRSITHIVGRCLLRGEYRQAVMTYLTEPSVIKETSLNEARRELLETMDFRKAYRSFPRRLEYERMMLLHLSNRPDSYANAIRSLPLRLRRLFIHAYQAYLFNRILSERVGYGLPLVQAEPGDKVWELNPQGNFKGEPVEVNRKNARSVNDGIRLGRMAIALPIIGFDTCLSDGRQGEIEKEVLNEEMIEKETFRMSAMPELRAYGGYRAATMKIKDFAELGVGGDSLNRDMVKVTFHFRLPRGSYATIVLREFMKSENRVLVGY